MPPSFRPDEILRVLQGLGVHFVVIGGMAGIAHGSPFPTADVDITPRREPENLARLSAALTQLEARIRTDAESLAAAGVRNLETSHGDLDISMVPHGTDGYADLVREAEQLEILGVVVPVASLADVIRSKQAANRPKDQRVLPTLRRILAARYDAD